MSRAWQQPLPEMPSPPPERAWRRWPAPPGYEVQWRRLAEAARQGYTAALVPVDSGPAPRGIRLIEVPDLGAAFTRLW